MDENGIALLVPDWKNFQGWNICNDSWKPFLEKKEEQKPFDSQKWKTCKFVEYITQLVGDDLLTDQVGGPDWKNIWLEVMKYEPWAIPFTQYNYEWNAFLSSLTRHS